jgi:hypothetical protein
MISKTSNSNGVSKWRKSLKSLGIAGFAFFLIKGIIWVLIFLGIGNYFK